jgi:hypothetical protein
VAIHTAKHFPSSHNQTTGLRGFKPNERYYDTNSNEVMEMSGTSFRYVYGRLGFALMLIGFFISVLGFSHAVNAMRGMSTAFRGFAELLFGMAFLLLGNGFINYSRSS